MALSRFFWFFSWLLLGSSVFVAVPVQNKLFARWVIHIEKPTNSTFCPEIHSFLL
jgi:hypothetical protein